MYYLTTAHQTVHTLCLLFVNAWIFCKILSQAHKVKIFWWVNQSKSSIRRNSTHSNTAMEIQWHCYVQLQGVVSMGAQKWFQTPHNGFSSKISDLLMPIFSKHEMHSFNVEQDWVACCGTLLLVLQHRFAHIHRIFRFLLV